MCRCLLAVIILVPFLFGASVPDRHVWVYSDAENVIVIVVDTLAAQHLGFMGYERDTSPFLDEFASNSVIFTRAYTPKSTTVPAFTSLLSGCHPAKHGVLENGVILPQDIHFLTDDFREAGFVTWGIPAARVIGAQYGLNRGFDYYANTPALPHPAPAIIDRLDRILSGSPQLGEPDYTKTSEPVFLMVHFYDTHTPFTPDEEIYTGFADPEYNGIVDGTWEQFRLYNEHELGLDESDRQEIRDLYDSEIRTFDENFGKLLELIYVTGLIDNSVIVVTADHGENLGGHHFITHGHPYEKSLHIPLIIHFPGNRGAGTRIGSLVENTDIIPTLLDLVGIEIPEMIDGRSMLPLIDPDSDEQFIEKEYFYAIGSPTDTGRTFSVFNGSHRLIADIGENGNIDTVNGVFLYDIHDDPEENFNLLEYQQDVLELLAPILAEIVIETRDGHVSGIDSQTLEMLASLGYI